VYSILVVGAGYVGGAVARYFKAKKQKVSVLVHRDSDRLPFEKEGILVFSADLTRPETLGEIPQAHFIVISVAPAERHDTSYRNVYVEGVGNFLAALRKNARPFLIVYLSSTGVWGRKFEDWVDETVSPEPETEREKILLEAEAQMFGSGFPAAIFRLAGIYGPGRNRIVQLQSGGWPPTGEPDIYMNMIHVEDVVAAVPVLFNRAREGEIYIGVDDEPVPCSQFRRWLGLRLGLEMSSPVQTAVKGKKLCNQRLKGLGVNLTYPTFREGYEALLQSPESPYKI
jgi:nucleoside-diphosphate-sugar epimerase